MIRSNQSWLSWLSIQRLIPLATVLVAFLAIIGSGLGIFSLSLFEQIALGILGLLAADALIERMKLLENIRQDLEILKDSVVFQPTLLWEEKALQEVPLGMYLEDCNELVCIWRAFI